MIRDIRLLKLYKQHYQDFFTNPLDVKYSSWGYYDGFEVVEPNLKTKSRLFTQKTEAPTSILYYGSGSEISQLDIGKSLQIIGIFRCATNQTQVQRAEKFWEAANIFPYFVVGFLKISENKLDYEKIGKAVEDRFDRPFNCVDEAGCYCLTYLTYDNADLVLFLTGNSISNMMNVLEEIESWKCFSYMHNIFGVSEVYLKESKKQGCILSKWNDVNCNVSEEIKQVEMRFVTSGNNEKILKGLKMIFDQVNDEWKIKNYQKLIYTYISGHENLLLKLEDTDVRSLLALLIPEGFLTHQNLMYWNGVYNIETSLYLKDNMWSSIEKETIEKRDIDKGGWCQSMIEEYSTFISEEFARGDEGFYSYFQSLLLTLNTLNQYEKFGISKEIFFMLYPALNLFDKMFMLAYNELRNTSYADYEKQGKLKEALCSFITCINSVIYHTIHTDQVFLMIPGYSGTSYSIPIKLHMMYYWFTVQIRDILNDGDIQCQCILVPEMEAHPKSNLFDFGKKMDNSLIYVYFSQRTLFLPRSLMIILAHEMGHYVGREIRMREERWDYLLDLTCRYVLEGIMQGIKKLKPNDGDLLKIYNEYKNVVAKNLRENINNSLTAYCESELNNDYHGSHVIKILKEGIACLLTINMQRIETAIARLPDALNEMLKDNQNFKRYSKFIYEMQSALMAEVKAMAYSGWMGNVLDELIKVFREVFSDVVALSILKCSFNDFHEAYQVSEGTILNEINVPRIQCIRELVVNEVFFQGEEKILLHGFGEENGEPYVEKNIYAYNWAKSHIINYAAECYKRIVIRYNQPEYMDKVKEVRRLFQTISNNDSSCLEVQNAINSATRQYIDSIKCAYDTDKTSEDKKFDK